MANQSIENSDVGWVAVDGNIDGPKLEWLVLRCKEKNLRTRVNNRGLEVQWTDVGDCYAILQETIGTSGAKYGDLDNDHSLFTVLVDVVVGTDIDRKYKQIVLESEDIDLPDVGLVRMWNVQSANVSAIGNVSITDDASLLTLYMRFKGGAYYRYLPVKDEVWQDIVTEAQKVEAGDQQASVGSLYHHAIKVPSDEGELQCHKLDGSVWRVVLPKSQRTSAADKYKKRGKK